MLSAYTKASEADMMKRLLGTNNTLYGTNTVIIDTSGGSRYLARGHLAPDANFIYNVEQVNVTQLLGTLSPHLLILVSVRDYSVIRKTQMADFKTF